MRYLFHRGYKLQAVLLSDLTSSIIFEVKLSSGSQMTSTQHFTRYDGTSDSNLSPVLLETGSPSPCKY